jgi:hypothetical protein
MDTLISPIWETVFTVVSILIAISVVISVVWPRLGWKIIDPNKKQAAKKQAARKIGSLSQFAIKTAIVAAAVVVSAWIMLDVLDDFADRRMQQFERTLRSATSLGGRQFWTKLENQLDALADPRSDFSMEKKQKLLTQIRAISDRWRPFLLEAASAIEGPTPAAGPSRPPASLSTAPGRP